MPTAHRLHEHQLVLTNPWPVPITGTMRVVSDEQWRITPRAHRFTISPGDEARFPVTIVPDRRMTAGVKTIEAEFELNATHPYQFRSQTTVRTGHPEIDLHTTWHTQPNLQTGRSDLVLDVRIGNIGERPLRLSVFLHTALAPPDRRTIGRLEPGEVTTQTFRIDDGFDKLVGTPIYVGVDDRDDAGRAIEEVVLEQGDLDP